MWTDFNLSWTVLRMRTLLTTVVFGQKLCCILKFEVGTGGSLQFEHIQLWGQTEGLYASADIIYVNKACWPLSRYFTEPLGIFMSSLNNTENPPNNPLKYHSVIHWTPGKWSIMTGYLTRSEKLLKSCLVVYSLRNGKTPSQRPPHNNIGSSLALILERCVRAGVREMSNVLHLQKRMLVLKDRHWKSQNG